MQVGLGSGHIVLGGDPAALPKGAAPPDFRPISVVAKSLDASRCHLVWREASAQATLCKMGTQPLPKRGRSPLPNFWPMSIVAKRLDGSRWHIVLDGDPAPLPPKGGRAPIFSPLLLWRNGWMHQDATWYGGKPEPWRLCVRWGPSPLPQKGRSPPNIRLTSIVAKLLHGSRCHLVRR